MNPNKNAPATAANDDEGEGETNQTSRSDREHFSTTNTPPSVDFALADIAPLASEPDFAERDFTEPDFAEPDFTEPDFEAIAAEYKVVNYAENGAHNRGHIAVFNSTRIWDNDRPDRFTSHRRATMDLLEWFNTHYNEKDENTIAGFDGPVWAETLPLDFDDADLRVALGSLKYVLNLLVNVYQVPSDELRIYFSGSKGFHLEIPHMLFGGFLPSVDLHERMRRAAAEVMGKIPFDTSVYDKLHLWRMPNSFNTKGNCYIIPLTYDQATRLNVNDIRLLAQEPRDVEFLPANECSPNETLVAIWQAAAIAATPESDSRTSGSGRGSLSVTHNPRPATADDMRRGQRYMEVVCSNLASMAPETGRNKALFNAALNLGHWAGAGALDAEDIRGGLYAASEQNRLVADTSAAGVRATIENGLNRGLREPLDLDADSRYIRSPRMANPRRQSDLEVVRVGRYEGTPRGILMVKQVRDPVSGGLYEVRQPLTNFTAEIVADVERDDGAEISHCYDIRAVVNGRHRTITVPAERFRTMNWVDDLGASAVICAGSTVRDQVREAVQLLSGKVPERRVFTHIGWREVDGRWIYLHGGGGIGDWRNWRTGALSGDKGPNLFVELPDTLSRSLDPQNHDNITLGPIPDQYTINIGDDQPLQPPTNAPHPGSPSSGVAPV